MHLRTCFHEPIPEIFEIAKLLQKAIKFHREGNHIESEKLFMLADNPNIKTWVESIIGKKSPYIQYRKITGSPSMLQKEKRVPLRMPSKEEKNKIHQRDRYQCRFCQTPVIRSEIRKKLVKLYPNSIRWGKTNTSRHAAFFAMWAQYDHIIPHARGGDNSLDNLVLTCTACNFGRMNYTLEEVGILFPKEYSIPIIPDWNGCEEMVT